MERQTSRMLATKVGQLINQQPDIVQLTDSVQDAARLMNLHGISSIPVCDGDHLVGAITEHDIVVRCAAEGLSPTFCRVDQCMRESPAALPIDATVNDALLLMQEKGRRSVCVTDEGRLVGMITLRRLQKFLAVREDGDNGKPSSRALPGKPAVNVGGPS